MSRDRGALALVLHSHMPYVEGFGTWPFGEEWLWEAIATSYLPLADLLERTGAPLTLGLTPVLCDQLEAFAGDAGARFDTFIGDIRQVVHSEDAAGLERAGETELAAEVRRAWGDYESAAGRHDLLARLGALPVELWTSAATHAVLPLLATDAGIGLQLDAGIASHERRFGSFGGGLWLPECAYAPGIERELAGHGVRLTCVDQTAVHGLGSHDALEPIETDAGVVCVPLDWSAIELFWTDGTGYPAHPSYRDYHRRTTHDLRPWANSGEPYRPQAAAEVAVEHARDFVGRCIERLEDYSSSRGRPGLLCCAFDTELLGHWWYEGPAWLEAVIAEAAEQGLRLTTVSDGIEGVEPVRRELETSSWGRGRDMSTWDSPRVAELAFDARRRELALVAAAAGGDLQGPRLERAARELLALQSSDWAFQVSRDQAGDYPRERAQAHSEAVGDLIGGRGHYASAPVAALRNLAPDLDPAPLLAP